MLIECKRVADSIELSPKPRVLGIIRWGENKEAEMYCKSIAKACEENSISVVEVDIENMSDCKVRDVVNTLVKACNKILCLKPFRWYAEKELQKIIPPRMDIDNFTKKSEYNSCTADAVIEILDYYNKKPCHAVVIGRGVGKDIAEKLLSLDYTITICHSETKNLAEITRQADLLISAVGSKNLITKDMVKEKAFVIDVGNDVSEEVGEIADVTPQRNGIGLITTKVLLRNILD